jgi:muramidase (phage lysozyme)
VNRHYYEGLLSNPNVAAMLNTIAEAEGCGDDYGCSFGGTSMQLSSSHPFPGQDCSFDTNGPRAVGRYQYCGSTWDELNSQLGGNLDFSNPRDQDIAAIARMDSRGVLDRVVAGDVEGALTGDGVPGSGLPPGLAYEWASLPPYRYPGQGTKSMADLVNTFRGFNGKPLPTSSRPASPSSPLSSAAAGVTSGNASYAAVRTDCPKFDYTYSLGKITTGCSMKAVAGFGAGTSLAGGGAIAVPGAAASASLLTVPNNLPRGMMPWPVRTNDSVPTGIFFSDFRTAHRPNHNGIDIASLSSDGVTGANCIAVLDGVVHGFLQPEESRGGGIVVYTKHAGDMYIAYMHLYQIKVSIGQQVKAGTVIGIEGTTGGSTGVHLHFQVMVGGQSGSNAIDPVPLIDQTGRLSTDISDDRFRR